MLCYPQQNCCGVESQTYSMVPSKVRCFGPPATCILLQVKTSVYRWLVIYDYDL